MDLATLGLEVKSDKVAKANTELGKFSGASKRAEAAAKGFGTGATNAATKVAVANDNVARSAGLVTKAYNAMRVATVAAIIGITAGLVGLTSLMGKFVSSSVEAQKQQAQLAAAIKSTGGAAGQTLASLNAHAAALQKVTNFGDEATNTAQGILLTFRKIGGAEFPRATEAVQDLAQALGTSLQSAAIQVGKALNDPVIGMTAMSRSGITFTESQKEMVKAMVASGNMIGAQTLILKELEIQFGGSAKAARETLGGALTALGNSWGDLFELAGGASEGLRAAIERLVTAISNPAFVSFAQTVGAVLFGAFQLAVNGAALLVNGINLLVDNIDTIGVAAGTAGALMAIAFGPAVMAAIVSGFVGIGTAGVSAIGLITAAMAANPLGALAVGITAAVTAIYVFRDEIQKAIGVDVVQIAKTAANTLIGSFVAAYEDIKFVWSNFGDILGAAVLGGVNVAIDGINKLVNASKTGVNQVISAINSIPGVDMDLLDTSGKTISNLQNNSASRLASAVGDRNAAVNAAMNKDYIGAISSAVATATPDIKAMSAALGDVENSATGAGAAMAKAANDNKDPWAGMRTAIDTANEGLQFARNIAGGFFSDLKNGLKNGEGFFESFKNAALSALDKITDKLLNQVLDAMFKVNKAGSGIGGGGGIGGIFGKLLGGLFGGGQLGIANAGGIGLYANGTSFAPGGAAIVGERGPELVNLPRGSQVKTAAETRRMLAPANSNGGNTTVNVINNSGGQVRTERKKGPNGDELVEVIIDKVKSEMGEGGFDGSLGGRYGATPVRVRRG